MTRARIHALRFSFSKEGDTNSLPPPDRTTAAMTSSSAALAKIGNYMTMGPPLPIDPLLVET